MIALIDIITFFISTYWLLTKAKYIGKNSRFLIFALVYIFYVFPMGLDWLYEMADYSYTSDRVGFILPRQDLLTNIIYDFGVLFVEFVILNGKIRKNDSLCGRNIEDHNKTLYQILMIAGMVLPAFATLYLIKEPAMLYLMQWRELKLFSTEGTYATVERFSYLGISCSVFILFDKKKRNLIITALYKIVAIAFIYMNICIQGKRAIIFYGIINIMVMMYLRLYDMIKANKSIRKYVLITAIVLLTASWFMISFTSTVKSERGYEAGSSVMYTTTRIDFLRDDRVRMAIYHSIYPNTINIVDYPCQTILGDVWSFIPLNYIAAKAGFNIISYQTRFTHALLKIDAKGKYDVEDASFMTVTFFAELISNLGVLFGFVFISLFCLWMIRMIDRHPYPYNAFIICCFILLNLFDFSYISVTIEFTIIICWLFWAKNKKRVNESINCRTTT